MILAFDVLMLSLALVLMVLMVLMVVIELVAVVAVVVLFGVATDVRRDYRHKPSHTGTIARALWCGLTLQALATAARASIRFLRCFTPV